VAEAKRRFSELIDRVEKGERIIVSRRGKPVLALCLPEHPAASGREAPAGLASVAGALADWSELEEVVEEIYAARRRSKDRPVEALGE
jgi:antitoxin (DNA-binding transcriptional repressor) of toxin-antitoxin stability system